MPFEINITPADVDALVKDTLIKSTLGKIISDAVIKALAPGFDSPIDKAVKSYVGEMAAQLIRTKFSEQIKASVAKVIEERVTNALLDNAIETAMKRIENAAQERY